METKKSILVVDDEPEMRELLRDFLKSQGYEVACAESTDEALQILQQNDRFNAIVADICMGASSGLQLAQKVKQNYPKISIFLFTGQRNIDDKRMAARLTDGYLDKPFSLIKLKKMLESKLSSSLPRR